MGAAAAERAVGFGFVRQRAAAPEEIDAAREDSRARRSDADRTTVQPAASSGASFQVSSSSGEFHGTMAATTPTGSRRV